MGDIFVLIMIFSFSSGSHPTSFSQEFFSRQSCEEARIQIAQNITGQGTIRSQGCYKK